MRFLRAVNHRFEEPEVYREVLPGGILFLAERVEHVPSLALGVWLRTGSRDEKPGEEGIVHFLEHMVFKGSRRHTAYQLAKRMESIGGQVDAFTTKETTCFYARVFEGHHRIAVEILAELLGEALFRREMVARERRVVVEEIQSYEDNPEERMQDLAAEVLWEGHSLGHPILGTAESLRALSTTRLRRFYQQHYTHPNLIVTAAGGLHPEQLAEEITHRFRLPAEAPANGRRPIRSLQPRLRHEERDLQQANLCLVRRGSSAHDPERHAQYVLSTILGAGMSSRLFQRIREEEGLAYSVYSFMDLFRDTGMFGIYLAMQPAQMSRALDLVCRELRRFRKHGVKRWELESAKAQILTGLFLSYESMYERINRLAQNELHYGAQVSAAENIQAIESIRAEDVERAAAGLLDPTKFSLITLGPPGPKRPELSDLDF